MRVLAALHGRGRHELTIHARAPGSCTFSRLGPVLIDAVEEGGHVQFAETTTAFADRGLVLIKPLRGPLHADEPGGASFALRVPLAEERRRRDLRRRAELRRLISQKEALCADARAAAERAQQELMGSPTPQTLVSGGERLRDAVDNVAIGTGGMGAVAAVAAKKDKNKPNAAAAAEQARQIQEQEANARRMRQKGRKKQAAADALKTRAARLRAQQQVLVLQLQREEARDAEPEAQAAERVEVVCGGVRAPLRRVDGDATLWRRDGVHLTAGPAALLVGGECVVKWQVAAL